MAVSRDELVGRIGRQDSSRLVVDPFFGLNEDDDRTVPASLDFHLGTRFVFLRRGRDTVHDPIREGEMAEASGTELFISLGEALYLHPGQLVLATTLEWYKLPPDLMSYVFVRSIWARRGVNIATAPAIQPHSSGRITLELSNVGEVAVCIRPGIALGQLFFHFVEESVYSEKDLFRQPPFAVTHRPIFGTYHVSEIERALLGTAAIPEPLHQPVRPTHIRPPRRGFFGDAIA